MRTALFIALLATSAFGEAASRLRVVLINDGANSNKRGADLSVGCDANRGGWESFLANAFQSAPDRVTVDVIQGDDSSPTGIRNFLNALTVAGNENIFVYYCGHGGWDRAKGHFFMLGLEGNILRSEVRNLLLLKRARGVLFITDSCTNFADFEFFPQAPEIKFPLFYDLFLQAEGLVDISSSSMGQESWFSKMGSVFSSQFSMAIVREKELYDTNRDGTVTWAEFFPHLQESVKVSFNQLKSNTPAGSQSGMAMRNARVQIPAFYFLSEWPQYQKRVWAENNTGENVRLNLHYISFAPQTNSWQWFPGDPQTTQGLSFEIGALRSIPLNSAADVPLQAARVRWTAVGLESGKNYESLDDATAPEGGYSLAADKDAANYKISFGGR